jgi:ABC-type branched-subunit amino acid transport system substrate-binding protein
MEHGVQLAFADANSAGGLTIGNTQYTFKVISLDDQYDTATTTNNLHQLVDTDGCQYIFTFQTEGTLALNAQLSSQKIIDFTVVMDNSVISQPTDAYTFRTGVPYSLQTTQYFEWIAQNYPNAKKMVLITVSGDNGDIILGATQKSCAAAGLTFQDSVLYDSGTTDFTSFLTKLLAEKPDMINVAGAPSGDAAVIIKAARSMGYTGLFVESTTAASDLLPIAGATALEGTLDTDLPMQAPYVSNTVLGLAAREVSKWGTAYGDTWDFYSQATTMFEAMQKANSIDTTAVKNTLQDPNQQFSYPAISGGVSTFDSSVAQTVYGNDATNQILEPWVICIIHNGLDEIQTVIEPPGATNTTP